MSKKFEQLKCSAIFAINSYNITTTYQIYGRAEAFFEMDAISLTEFNQLNDMLTRKAINNPAWVRKTGYAYDKYRKEHDIA